MRPKILLVDDRDDNLLSMESILEPDGYRFVKANSGRQALKILLSDIDFALILMDVKMPNLSGFETAALIYDRDKLRHIPIIFITANNYGEENVFEGYRAGAVDYIYKPVKPELLRAKVAVFIELYKKNHRLLAQEEKLLAINKSLEIEINERKTSEERINELNRQLVENVSRLEAVNKELDYFAFMASHDLQAPLRKIRVFSDRLYLKYHESMDEDGRNYLERMQHTCERMQQLINDILAFSKISADGDGFELTDLNEAVKEVIGEMESAIHEKNAHIETEKLPSLRVNPVLIRPLFSNLIGNALKFSKKDIPPRIKIYAEITSTNQDKANKLPDNKFCRICVEDNGIGFEQKHAKQIFDMFRRLNPIAEFKGTGIGLAICKRITEKHKGFIYAQSQPNVGSTFVVSIPTNLPEKVHLSYKHKV
ncbi:MAG: hybrid sensor histidine kinase/response regulator [Bacteroidetes bacterium]|nr:MAG: hybrid sensor histidine kinase/response regulator [Bacteroidota bacterium]